MQGVCIECSLCRDRAGTVHRVFFCCCMDRAGTVHRPCIDCPELNDQLAHVSPFHSFYRANCLTASLLMLSTPVKAAASSSTQAIQLLLLCCVSDFIYLTGYLTGYLTDYSVKWSCAAPFYRIVITAAL